MSKNCNIQNSDTFIPDSELPTNDSDIITDQLSSLLEESCVEPKKNKINNNKISHDKISHQESSQLITDATYVSKEELDELKIDISQVLKIINKVFIKIDEIDEQLNNKLSKLDERITALEQHVTIKTADNNKTNINDDICNFILANIDNQFNKKMDAVLELVDKRCTVITKQQNKKR